MGRARVAVPPGGTAVVVISVLALLSVGVVFLTGRGPSSISPLGGLRAEISFTIPPVLWGVMLLAPLLVGCCAYMLRLVLRPAAPRRRGLRLPVTGLALALVGVAVSGLLMVAFVNGTSTLLVGDHASSQGSPSSQPSNGGGGPQGDCTSTTCYSSGVPCAPSSTVCVPCGANSTLCVPCGPNATSCTPVLCAELGSQTCQPCERYGSSCIPCEPDGISCLPCELTSSGLCEPCELEGSSCVPCEPNSTTCVPCQLTGSDLCQPCEPNGTSCVPCELTSGGLCQPCEPNGTSCVPCEPNSSGTCQPCKLIGHGLCEPCQPANLTCGSPNGTGLGGGSGSANGTNASEGSGGSGIDGNNSTAAAYGTRSTGGFAVVVPDWTFVLVTLGLCTTVGVLSIPGVLSAVVDRRPGRGRGNDPSAGPVELRAAVEEALRSLDAGESPRGAIVRLYGRLLAKVGAGAQALEASTAQEIQRSRLDPLHIPSARSDVVTQMFELACYSTHAIDRPALDRYLEALRAIDRDLAHGAPL